MMTLKELYMVAVEAGIDADPRGRAGVEKLLARRNKEYGELSEAKKKEYDQEDLWDPYIDSGILAGDPGTPVKKIMAGIDIDVGEVAVAGVLNDRGAGIDALVAHHPQSTGYAALHEVMEMQAENMANYGVPINVAEGIMRERIGTPSLVVCLDSGCGNYDQLWLTTSLRGIAAGRLSVEAGSTMGWNRWVGDSGAAYGIDHFGQVVRRDARGHTDGDADGAVQQQVRQLGRQNARFVMRTVVVRRKVDGIFLDIEQ